MNLTELKNIRGRLAQMLKDIGIDSVERLAEADVFQTWTELQRVHPKETSLQTLWELQGAILDVDPEHLPHGIRHQLKLQHERWQKEKA